MIVGYGLVAFRDPRGIRPLVYHQNKDRVIIASESIVVNPQAVDVGPGECVIFPKNGGELWERCAVPNYTPCIFEYIYFAHKNSVINGISVYEARQVLGQLLSKHLYREDYDMIVPIPKTSCVSAKELSRILEVPYEEVLTVRRGRSFILPKQTIRISLIEEKFRLDAEKCKGKRILLVDDSIVRGTTMRSLVKRFWEAGAIQIDIASCAPPVYSPNVYGIDISSPDELVANKGVVADLLDADKVIYQDLEEMKSALLKLNPTLEGFECSMFIREEASP
jgi:amidophosphoribosyltransferase